MNNCYRSFVKITAACFLIFITAIISFAQFQGAPVKKDRLLKALRSKQLQTRDIVTIINSNGVDFDLTPEVEKDLVSAGARPEVIKAVSENRRSDDIAKNRKKDRNKSSSAKYDNLIDQAMQNFEDRKNSKQAIRFLETAIKMNPKNPAAYQLLGFVNLYGLNDFPQAKTYMSESIKRGGSAVFRVFHDDNGNFTERCTGSLFISPENIRYESDDNIHTFETSIFNIDKIKLDTESSKIWKNYPIFKVFLKIGDSDIKFRFAPTTGREEESKMVARFVQEAKIYVKPTGTAINFSK